MAVDWKLNQLTTSSYFAIFTIRLELLNSLYNIDEPNENSIINLILFVKRQIEKYFFTVLFILLISNLLQDFMNHFEPLLWR